MKNSNLIRYFVLFLFLSCAFEVYAAKATVTIEQIIKGAKVTINVKDTPLDEILKLINKQTKIDYGYQSDQNIDKTRLYSLNVKDVSMENALNTLLYNSDYSYRVVDNKIIITRIQSKILRDEVRKVTIKGKVIDVVSSKPVVGATVLVKGSTKGAITDENGDFIFAGNSNDELEISYIGMKKMTYNKPIADAVAFLLKMERDAINVDDVVVTGYQKINRNELSSSVTTINGEDVLQGNAHTLDNLLQGKVAGLSVLNSTSTPGATTKIRIRGTSTISGNQEPLWVVDGVIVDDPVSISSEELNSLDNVNLIGNAISGLNPMDIDKIHILKDASATAIYGVRAANGVIVVTTKKGKLGKTRVSYSGNFAFTERPSYNALKLMNSKERIDVSKEIERRGLPYQFTPAAIGYEGQLFDLYDRKINYDEFLTNVKRIEETNTDWFDLLYRTSFSQTHNVSVSGASDKVNYYFSGAYLDDNANVKGTGMEQYNGTMKLGIKLHEKVRLNLQFRSSINNKDYLYSAISPYSYAYNTSRAVPALNSDGTYAYYNAEQGFNAQPLQMNILNEIENSERNINNSSLNFNADLEWRIFKDLRFSGTIAINNANTSDKEWFNDRTYEAAKLRRLNYGAQFPDSQIWQNEQCILPYGGKAQSTTTNNFGYTMRSQLDYNKMFNDKHLITLAGGFEARSTRYKGLKSTQWGYLPDRGEKVAVINPAIWPRFNELQMNNPDVFTNRLSNYVSVYGVATYSYNSKYIFNANIRADGSNKFGQDKSTRFLPIWSVSGRWNIHNEKLFDNTKWLNELSIKGSYGIQGNVSDDQTPNMIIKLGSIDQTSGEYMSTLSKLPNPFLKWEKTTSYNVALDFAILDNRLSGTVEYYYKKGRDQIVSVEVSGTTGTSFMSINAGDMMNKGYEVTINAVPVRTSTFTWSLSMNGSKNINRVTRGGLQGEYTYNQYINGTAVLKDYSLYSFFSYKFDKLNDIGYPTFKDTEQPEGATKADMYNKVFSLSGNRVPDIQGGLSTTFKYKQVTLGLNFSYSLGAKIRRNNLYSNTGQRLPNPQQNMSKEFVNRWRNVGDEAWAFIPTLSSDRLASANSSKDIVYSNNLWQMYNQSDLRVVSGDFLRLRTAYVRYAIPSRLLNKIGLQSASIRAEGNNLWLFASKKLNGQDPEQVSFGGIGNTTPPVSTFSLGIDITF